MKFYFYTNKNIMFDFLGRNIIAPDPIVRDIKRYRTISTASDCFLFITHKKLSRKSREQGIAEPEFVYPITLELSESLKNDGPAVLISKDQTGFRYTLESLSEYDAEKHIGAYLFGEIPLSRIEKIYFDTQDDQDMFSRPSPDYWYPTDKYALLPDGFCEELTLTLEENKIIAVSGLSKDELLSGMRRREKQRAAILNFINHTRNWQHDMYLFNADERLLQLVGLKDSDVVPFMPHYAEVKNKDNVEDICLVNEASMKSTAFNQKIYDYTYNAFVRQPYNTQKQPDQIIRILESLCGQILAECKSPMEVNIIKRTFGDIEKLVSDDSDKGPEEIVSVIPEPISVLKALLFVVKNPNRYELFLESLNAYHVDLITKRRAAVLWGALNGLYGMPGFNYNKDNQELWQYIEAFVYEKEKQGHLSLAVAAQKAAVEKGEVLGIRLKEEYIVTASEVRRAILNTPEKSLTEAFYKKLLEAAEVELGSKKKVENRGYTNSVASIDLLAIKKGDVLTPNIKKSLEQLLKDCKSSVPDKESLFRDYVVNENKFTFVFDMDPDYWKRSFMVASGKKNA